MHTSHRPARSPQAWRQARQRNVGAAAGRQHAPCKAGWSGQLRGNFRPPPPPLAFRTCLEVGARGGTASKHDTETGERWGALSAVCAASGLVACASVEVPCVETCGESADCAASAAICTEAGGQLPPARFGCMSGCRALPMRIMRRNERRGGEHSVRQLHCHSDTHPGVTAAPSWAPPLGMCRYGMCQGHDDDRD